MLGKLLDTARRIAAVRDVATLAAEGVHGADHGEQPVGLKWPIFHLEMLVCHVAPRHVLGLHGAQRGDGHDFEQVTIVALRAGLALGVDMIG